MQLSDISKKPELTLVKLDDQSIIDEFGEPLEFYTWDRQPLDLFMKLASASQNDPASMIAAIKPMILDVEGNQILRDGLALPNHIIIKIMTKLTIMLANSFMGCSHHHRF